MTALSERLLGRWCNTAGVEAQVIAAIEIVPTPAGVRLTPTGAGAPDRVAWPTVECALYACGEEDQRSEVAAHGKLELDARAIELQLRVNKGILCVMSWVRPTDPRKRAWVTRELFAREVAP